MLGMSVIRIFGIPCWCIFPKTSLYLKLACPVSMRLPVRSIFFFYTWTEVPIAFGTSVCS